MTMPSNPHLFGSSSSNYPLASSSSGYSPTYTSTPFATPAMQLTCQVLHAHQQHHQQLTRTGHSCQSHTIWLTIWNLSDLNFDADDDIHVQHDDVPSLGKPVGFSAKCGLLFSAPSGTALDPPPASLAEAIHLDGGIGKGFMLSTAPPLRIG
ncbi:uncharacterized protein UBRO_20175 [Ustilago bromivora]|uniref:Uncharacterized protein n=1 Tax=Ustilago bromivora TaxID=307758 RepID=A0A1K0HBT2_9BASI|nr:uncharacterized protein UBRO_20175 [Ustilago bromivora]